jgi:hypothetical protein
MKDDLPVTVVKSLSDCGKDEYWLQDKISEDSSILGLGDLERVTNEKVQSSGGRLDLLLKDPEDDSMFEVELMLGKVDESHIIRTIEYWDIEKRRWGKRNHTAVLVAERINTRFINVVHLLSQAIPIIGIQVSVVELEGKRGLHFTEMINSYEEPEEEGDSPPVDEAYWKKEHPDTLIFAKGYEALANTLFEDVNLRFVQGDIAVTIGGWNRIWIWPAKGGLIWVGYRLEEKEIEGLKKALEAKGILPKIKLWPNYTYLRFTTEKDSLTKFAEEHKKLLLGLYAKDLKRKG